LFDFWDWELYNDCMIKTVDRAFREIDEQREGIPYEAIRFLRERFYDDEAELLFVSTPSKKPGRNDPCYCGSGRKYKKCCLLKEDEVKIYQLKVALEGSKPPIWRRVLIKSNFTLGDLHTVIQCVMESWDDDHLHEFMVNGESYGEKRGERASNSDYDEEDLTLKEIVRRGVNKFSYTYDFGDDWEHVIIIEKELDWDEQQSYPVCVAGKRACPPEDIGGIWEYEGFVEAQDPKSKGHKAMRERWDGDPFDPERFDLEEVNGELRKVF
jgi:hypothetical protein